MLGALEVCGIVAGNGTDASAAVEDLSKLCHLQLAVADLLRYAEILEVQHWLLEADKPPAR